MPHRPFVPMTLRLIFAALAHCNRKGEAAERCKKSSEKCVLAHHSNESTPWCDKAQQKRLGGFIHEALLNPRRSVRPKWLQKSRLLTIGRTLGGSNFSLR